MGGFDERLELCIDVEGSVAFRSRGAAGWTGECAAGNKAFVDSIGGEELLREMLVRIGTLVTCSVHDVQLHQRRTTEGFCVAKVTGLTIPLMITLPTLYVERLVCE